MYEENNNNSLENANTDMEKMKELVHKRDEAIKWFRAFEDKCHRLILLIKEAPEVPNVDALRLYEIINKKILEISVAYNRIANTYDPFYDMNIRVFIDVCNKIRNDYELEFDELIEFYSTYPKIESESKNEDVELSNHEKSVAFDTETKNADYKTQIITLIDMFMHYGVISKELLENVRKPKNLDFRVRVCLHELDSCVSNVSSELFTEDDLRKCEGFLNKMMRFSFYSDEQKDKIFEDIEEFKNELLDRENHKRK